MDKKNQFKFSNNVSLILIFLTVMAFLGGFVLGQKSRNLANSSSAKVSVFAPQSEISSQIIGSNFMNSITGKITNILPAQDGNIVIEVTGVSIIDLVINLSGTGAGNTSNQPCTMEAKICPDGTSVGRVGPNCEFAPCSGEKPQVAGENPPYTPVERKYGFVVTPETQIILLSLPVPDIPISNLIGGNLPSSVPPISLTMKDLKTGMSVTVYPGANQKIAQKIEVVSSAIANPTIANPTGSQKIPPADPSTSCTQDTDCRLINKEQMFNCCPDNCQPVDYSLDQWISVNSKWYQDQLTNRCATAGRCLDTLCQPIPINDRYSSRCVNLSCMKVPL
jgi:hypothetical protein